WSEALERPGRVLAEQFGEQVELEVPADDRRGVERRARSGSEPLDAADHDLADADGQVPGVQAGRSPPAAVVPLADGARLGEIAEDLGDEERVALRLRAQGVP